MIGSSYRAFSLDMSGGCKSGSSLPEVVCRKVVLKNFSKFT